MDGNVTTEGRVEVYRYPDGWGTVCDDDFDDADAEVVCRMLEFSGGEAVLQAFFGEGSGGIFLDNLNCTGDEQDLWDCPRNEWGEHNCDHSGDAGVKCSKYRDVNPDNKTQTKWPARHEICCEILQSPKCILIIWKLDWESQNRIDLNYVFPNWEMR